VSDNYCIACQLVGESFDNPDGSSRQAEIAKCRVGEEIILSFETDNPHDPAALAVLSIRDVKIGYISGDIKMEVLEAIAEDRLVNAAISAIYGGRPGKPLLGVEVELECKEEEF